MALIGDPSLAPPGAPRLLFVRARIEDDRGEASGPAQAPLVLGAIARGLGWDVRCIDAYLEDDVESALRDALREYPADVVGLTALTAEFRSMHRLARVARASRPGAVVLAGGPHASADPEETVANEAIDAAVLGEGERTLEDVLVRVARGEPWQDVPGLALRGPDGRVRHTAPRPAIEDLDSLPMPAFDLTDIDAYALRRGMSQSGIRRYMPITTSRGCPYRCTYCHDIQGKRFRAHSPAWVLRMIDELRERWNVHSFDVTDDIFNFDGERMVEICDGLAARGPGISFACPNGIRADRMTPAQAERMSDAGLDYVAIAIETAVPRLQKQIRKHLRFDKVMPVIDVFARRRVLVSGFFMVGFPGETEEEMQATIDFACRSRLHTAYFFVTTPFAGTEMHEEIVAERGAEAAAIVGSGFFFRPVVNLSAIPDDRFARMRRNAYLRFYGDPRRIVRIFLAHPRKRDLLEYFATVFFRDTLRIEPARLLARLSRRPAPSRREPTPAIAAK